MDEVLWTDELVKKFGELRPVIGVDFDGTVVHHRYPEVGDDLPLAAELLTHYVQIGARLLLNTMRSGAQLREAVEWFRQRNIPLWAVETNPEQHTWTTSPKPYCHLYIDDAALGAPLTHYAGGRPAVDWVGVDRLLREWATNL